MKKRNRTTFLVIFLLLTSAHCSLGQVPELITNEQFHPDAKAAVDSIYNFSDNGADKQLAEWKKKYPHHPIWKLMDGIKFWWKVLSDLDDRSHDEKFFKMMKRADYAAKKLLYDHPNHLDGLVIKAISNGYIARQYANRSEWLSSLKYARDALKAEQRIKDLKPNLPDLKFAEGLKLYYAAYLPEQYPVVKTVSWFLPDGDKKKGLKALHEAAQHAVFSRAEAKYFLGTINYRYENDYSDAVQDYKALQEAYPNNNYYARILVKNYYQLRQYDKAFSLINRSLKRWKNKKLPFQKVLKEELLTWKGRILERRGQDDKALKSFEDAFSISSGLPDVKHRSYYVASGYEAGKLAYQQHEVKKAKSYLKKILKSSVGSSYKDRAREILDKM